MNQLVKISEGVVTQLPTSAQVYVRAKMNPTVSQMRLEEAINAISVIITDGIKMLGQWNQAEQSRVIQFMQEKMTTILLGKFKHVTIQEFKLAVERGCTGEYRKKSTDLVMVSVENMCFWIDCFLKDDVRRMSLIDYDARLRLNDSQPKRELTEEEIERIVSDGANKAWENFKEDGSMPFACGAIYDYLRKKDGIKWSEEERKQIEREAEISYKDGLKSLNPLQKSKEGTADGLLVEKKRVALRKYFEKKLQSETKRTNA